ncbi:hypothetical protein HGM15179_017260 [Zosterops borbonicus]|uniref:Fibronectin type-III domain-containing protein n=1 Tax=Zosterops borbonicus TaxID=364589 RepID=A0A8K1G1E1_9PASS|nr:hypothetical protein HGM15179_017260 [Zosterops borbonicus]
MLSPAQGLHAWMALPVRAMTFFLALALLLLAQGQMHHGPVTPWVHKEAGKCKAPLGWDPQLRFKPKKDVYALNEVVQLSCVGELVPSIPQIQCISRGTQVLWNETATCKEACHQPQWDSQLQFNPNQTFYWVSEEVALRCFMNDTPPLATIRCANRTSPKSWKNAWEMLDISGTWHRLAENLTCTMAKCSKPQWDARLQFSENEIEYPQNRELTLTCPKGLGLSFPMVKCTKEFQGVSSGKPVYVDAWWSRNSPGAWTRIERDVLCTGCQRPSWDSRLQLAPDKENYKKNEKVNLSCPKGFQPSFTHVKCSSKYQNNNNGTRVYKEFWNGRNSGNDWLPIQSSVECVEVLRVDPDTFEISSTSIKLIKLHWTCRFPDACRGTRAMCRLAAPPSPPCGPEELNGEQMLHGQEGTFTCSPLQPFTEYSVTIDFPPNTTLFSWLFTTEEAVPDKPEELWLDPDRGSLRWNSLPSCNGEIIGYQLNITARNAGDSSVLETERLRLNGSVTEHRLPEHRPGSSYAVTIRGLTAAGAGAALMREFPTGSSGKAIGCRGARDISPSQGTAVLPLRPIARPSEAAREHQLIVATTHDASVIESICSGQPQLSNASTYLAAVLNLTAPTDFVLGDGSRGQGRHNAALRPGCDYTALLLLARLSPQAEKFTCVCYSFSVGAGQTVGQWHGIVIGLVVLLAVVLVAAVILWFVLSRKRLEISHFSPSQDHRDIQSSEDVEKMGRMTPAQC